MLPSRFAESVFGEPQRRTAIASAKIRRGERSGLTGVTTSRQPGMSLAPTEGRMPRIKQAFGSPSTSRQGWHNDVPAKPYATRSAAGAADASSQA